MLGFKLTKHAGWPWQRTRMTHPARAARLWLASAVATLWLVRVGAVAPHTMEGHRLAPGRLSVVKGGCCPPRAMVINGPVTATSWPGTSPLATLSAWSGVAAAVPLPRLRNPSHL